MLHRQLIVNHTELYYKSLSSTLSVQIKLKFPTDRQKIWTVWKAINFSGHWPAIHMKLVFNYWCLLDVSFEPWWKCYIWINCLQTRLQREFYWVLLIFINVLWMFCLYVLNSHFVLPKIQQQLQNLIKIECHIKFQHFHWNVFKKSSGVASLLDVKGQTKNLRPLCLKFSDTYLIFEVHFIGIFNHFWWNLQ